MSPSELLLQKEQELAQLREQSLRDLQARVTVAALPAFQPSLVHLPGNGKLQFACCRSQKRSRSWRQPTQRCSRWQLDICLLCKGQRERQPAAWLSPEEAVIPVLPASLQLSDNVSFPSQKSGMISQMAAWCPMGGSLCSCIAILNTNLPSQHSV